MVFNDSYVCSSWMNLTFWLSIIVLINKKKENDLYRQKSHLFSVDGLNKHSNLCFSIVLLGLHRTVLVETFYFLNIYTVYYTNLNADVWNWSKKAFEAIYDTMYQLIHSVHWIETYFFLNSPFIILGFIKPQTDSGLVVYFIVWYRLLYLYNGHILFVHIHTVLRVKRT